MRTVGVLGLGLVGGSLARDLARAGWRVLAADREPGSVEAARAAGVVDGPLELGAVERVELVVLAVPVRAAPALLRELSDSIHTGSDLVVTDVGSTKRSVVAAAAHAGLAARFVGAHPMAGSHRSGWDASRTGLFHGSRVWVCPTSSTEENAVATVESMWRSVGGRPERITPHDHDLIMARASHLPQLTASALAATLARYDVPPGALGPGGRDTTRLAGSDPDIWTDILLDNADHVAPALDALTHELAALADLIRSDAAVSLRSRLAAGRAWSGS